MKIIYLIGDATKLEKGEQYIIGFDYNSPEAIDYKNIQQIQDFIDKKFNT